MREGKAFAVWCSVSFMLIPLFAIQAETHCQKAVTDAVADSICRQLVDDAKNNQVPPAMIDSAVRSVAAIVSVGQRGTFGETDGCFEVSRVQIQLFCENLDGLLVDEFIDQGDGTDRQIIQVASCQIPETNDTNEYYASASVQVFLKNSDAVGLELSADRQKIEIGESAKMNARLMCEGCSLKNQEIFILSMGPGEVSSQNATTGEDGVAEVIFTATGKGTAMVSANNQENHAELEFQISRLFSNWDVEITINEFDEDRGHNDVLSYMERWTSEVEFQDVLFYEITPLDEQSPLDLLRLTQMSFGQKKKGPFYKTQGRFTEEEYIDYWRKKNLKRNFRGKRKGEPLWILFPSVDCYVDNGLAAKSEDCLAVLSIGLDEGLPREDPIRVYFESDYYRRFSPFSCEVKFPFRKILEGQAFTVNHEEHEWHELGVEVRMIPKD